MKTKIDEKNMVILVDERKEIFLDLLGTMTEDALDRYLEKGREKNEKAMQKESFIALIKDENQSNFVRIRALKALDEITWDDAVSKGQRMPPFSYTKSDLEAYLEFEKTCPECTKQNALCECRG